MGEGRRERAGKKVVKLEGVDGRKGDWRGTIDGHCLQADSGFRLPGNFEKGGDETNPLEKVSVQGVKTNGGQGCAFHSMII